MYRNNLNPHDLWASHRDLLAIGLEVMFRDPYAGTRFGEGDTPAIHVTFRDDAAVPVKVSSSDNGINVDIGSELYSRARGASLVLTRCRFLRRYPLHYIARSYTPKGAKDALDVLLHWSGSLVETRADLVECFEVAGTHEPYSRFSLLGSESETLCLFVLLVLTTLHVHEHLLRNIHLGNGERLTNISGRLRGTLDDSIFLLSLSVVGAGLADQLGTDLSNIFIIPRTRRHMQRIVQLCMLLAMAFEIARDLGVTATMGSWDTLLEHGADILVAISFRTALEKRVPEPNAELVLVSFIKGKEVYRSARQWNTRNTKPTSKGIDNWIHDLAELSEALNERVQILQGIEGLRRWQETSPQANFSIEEQSWRAACALFNPLGPIGVEVFDSDNDGTHRMQGGTND